MDTKIQTKNKSFKALDTKIQTKMDLSKLWIRIHLYTAADFQGWLKVTLKVKTAYFSIFRRFLEAAIEDSLRAVCRATQANLK